MRASAAAGIVVGAVILLAGLVFTLQGMGIILGSYMTGDPTYIYVGAMVAIVGIILIAAGYRSHSSSGSTTASAAKSPP